MKTGSVELWFGKSAYYIVWKRRRNHHVSEMKRNTSKRRTRYYGDIGSLSVVILQLTPEGNHAPMLYEGARLWAAGEGYAGMPLETFVRKLIG